MSLFICVYLYESFQESYLSIYTWSPSAKRDNSLPQEPSLFENDSDPSVIPPGSA